MLLWWLTVGFGAVSDSLVEKECLLVVREAL